MEQRRTSRSSPAISRRAFIGGTAAAAAMTIAPASVLGGSGRTAPSEKLNIAGIGVGGQGRWDIDNVSSENIVALCDVDWARAADTFKSYPKAKKYRDFRVMLEKENGIDAVVVATPDHVHAVASMMAIKMGKHVYCEKPLAKTLAEARDMTELSLIKGVQTHTAFVFRYLPAMQLAKEIIASGQIGRPQHFRCKIFHNRYLDPELPLTWRLQRAVAGGGALVDLGIHGIDLLRYTMGEIAWIQCVGSRCPENPNCSRICCQSAVKNALRILELNPTARIFVLYRDMRTYGFQEDYYKKAREKGVIFVRYEVDTPPEVQAADEQLQVTFNDPILNRKVSVYADYLCLSTGLIADEESTEDLGRIFRIPKTFRL